MSVTDFLAQHKRKASDCFEHDQFLPPIAEQQPQQFGEQQMQQMLNIAPPIGHSLAQQQPQQCAFQMSVYVPPGSTPNLGGTTTMASPNLGTSPPSLYGGTFTPPSMTSLGHTLSSGISAHSMSTTATLAGHSLNHELCMPVDHLGVPIPIQRPTTPDGLPSVGSAGHCNGTCRRCVFFDKGRCLNGVDCNFCHLPHEKRKRTNKKRRRYPQGAAPPAPA